MNSLKRLLQVSKCEYKLFQLPKHVYKARHFLAYQGFSIPPGVGRMQIVVEFSWPACTIRSRSEQL